MPCSASTSASGCRSAPASSSSGSIRSEPTGAGSPSALADSAKTMVDHPQGPAPSDDRAVSLLRQMLEIASPSYHEAPLAEFLAVQLPELGFTAEVDAAGNVVGELVAGDGPTVMLLGHLD